MRNGAGATHGEAGRMRIVARTHIIPTQIEALAQRCGVSLVTVNDAENTLREVRDADALWLWPAFYDAELAAELARNAERLTWLQLMTMGYDPVEEFGAPSTLTVTNAGDAYAPTVAEHALALLLALLRQLPAAIARGASQQWDSALGSRVATLNDATVAIVGFGTIGREIAARVRACGARVIGVSRSGRPDALADEIVGAASLHDALRRCDAAVVALPLSASTRGLFDAAAFASLPKHAVLVNIARGAIVDSAALRDALENGQLAGAGLDVTDPEPLPLGDPLWTAPNLIVTPHVAGYGGLVPGRRVLALIERNLRNVLAGSPLEARVTIAARENAGAARYRPSDLRTTGR